MLRIYAGPKNVFDFVGVGSLSAIIVNDAEIPSHTVGASLPVFDFTTCKLFKPSLMAINCR